MSTASIVVCLLGALVIIMVAAFVGLILWALFRAPSLEEDSAAEDDEQFEAVSRHFWI